MPLKGVVLFAEASRPANGRVSRHSVPGLEHVANRPIAHHVLDAVLASGIEELIVAGTAQVLTEASPWLVEYKSRLRELEYVLCGDGEDPLAGLAAAAPVVGDAACLVHPAEGLLAHPLTTHVESLCNAPFDLILLCADEAPAIPLCAEHAGGAGYAPSLASPAAEISLFGPGVLREACELGARRHLVTIDAVARSLSEKGRRVRVCPANGWRRFAGRPGELLELNRLVLDRLGPTLAQPNQYGNQIEGAVAIDPGATVRSSVIVGPVVVGQGAIVKNAYIGPYTAVGAGAKIEGAEIERSILARGAVLTHMGARVVSSVIGRRARVTRDFSLPRAMRLWVGEGDEVALC